MNITVYSTASCGICHALMQWLTKNGRTYHNVVVDEEPAGMAQLMEVSGGAIGVPYTVIEQDDGTIETVSGFDMKKLSVLV